MPYEVVERRLRMVPEQNLDEVLSFIDGLLVRCRADKSKMPDELGCYDDPEEEEKALARIRRASMRTVWETVKDDESDIPDEEIAARHMQAVGLATMWETVKNDTW